MQNGVVHVIDPIMFVQNLRFCDFARHSNLLYINLYLRLIFAEIITFLVMADKRKRNMETTTKLILGFTCD